jgi:hypothetical protein
MNPFEVATLAISAGSAVFLAMGVVFAGVQLRKTRQSVEASLKIHRENHDFQRRYAAQEALRSYDYSVLSGPLETEFRFLENAEPISLRRIQEAFRANSELQRDLHQLLNYYEALARGVRQGVFCEDVVKAGRRKAMIVAANSFQTYIEHRRKQLNPQAWTELTQLCHKWRAEKVTPPKKPTAVD